MNFAAIVQWLQLAFLLLTFGKKAVDLAIDIYERIEFWSQMHPETVSSKDKASRFDRLYMVESIERKGVIPPPARISAIREGVWKTRPENRGKKRAT